MADEEIADDFIDGNIETFKWRERRCNTKRKNRLTEVSTEHCFAFNPCLTWFVKCNTVSPRETRRIVKITAGEVFVCSPGRNFVTLKIQTDEGIFGLGDATLNGRELAVASYLEEHVIPCLIGRDPFQTEDIWQYLYRGAYWRGGPVTMTSIAAVDTALWDIKGKALNLPVWKLLGGGFHQKIRAYASTLFGPTPEATGEIGRRLVDKGFTAVKFGWDPMGQDRETDRALVREPRRGIGPQTDLLIDAGLVWDAKTALQRAGDRLVQRHAQRIQIRARVDAILTQHLGRHVL